MSWNVEDLKTELAYYGVPKKELTAAAEYAAELLEDRDGELDLAQFASDWSRM